VKPHRFDPLSFMAGAVFVGLGIAFLAAGDTVLDQAHWLWPAILLVLGGTGLATAFGRDRDRDL